MRPEYYKSIQELLLVANERLVSQSKEGSNITKAQLKYLEEIINPNINKKQHEKQETKHLEKTKATKRKREVILTPRSPIPTRSKTKKEARTPIQTRSATKTKLK